MAYPYLGYAYGLMHNVMIMYQAPLSPVMLWNKNNDTKYSPSEMLQWYIHALADPSVIVKLY